MTKKDLLLKQFHHYAEALAILVYDRFSIEMKNKKCFLSGDETCIELDENLQDLLIGLYQSKAEELVSKQIEHQHSEKEGDYDIQFN